MAAGGFVELAFGVKAEGQSLETVTKPLTAVSDEAVEEGAWMGERVVVLGGGLAGVACAHQLGDDGVDVTLVDRNDYHQFQPLLYQVASSQLPAEDVARPHRTIFREYPTVTVVTAQVTAAATVRTQSDALRRADVDRVASGDGSGCPAELLRSARRRRVCISAVFGGRRRTAAPTSPGTAGGRNGRSAVSRARFDSM